MALDDRQILNMIGEELSQSAGGNENDFIDANRQQALASYLGQPNGKEVEGRSSIVSTDVADAIEWIMPEIVKAFTQNNEVVTFDPVYSGDEDQAELESQYVYDILMKDNNGFLVIHQFVKDALMQKNGFIKVFYESIDKVKTERYTGLTEVEMQMVLADPEIEIVERTEHEEEVPVFDIKVKRTTTENKINVVSVPPEEFRVNKQHNSVDLSTARFTAHVLLKTAGDLIEEGYDREFVDAIPSSNVYEDDREYRFYMQDETVYPDRDNSLDPALRTLEISECYMHMDMNEDGIAELVKITVAGGDNPDVLLDYEEVDEIPFISATAILMSHKLFGLSIYDRLKQIQEQKTTLWRNIFDNMYLQNNQRTIVVDGQVNIDDLMVSRPGGIIRAKRIDAITPFPTPPLNGDAYKMMDYLDQVRAARSGVSPEGPVTDSMIGDRVGSEGVQSMMSQKEELVGLMIRVIAETGIKPLCYMIRSQAMRHQDVMKEYRFRGKWMNVNPSNWTKRSTTTVRVGTGSGNRKEQMQVISQLMILQEKMSAMPGQAMVREQETYSAINDFAKSGGLSGASKYFLDPKSEEGQQHKQQVTESQKQSQQQQQEEQKAMMDLQTKLAEAELSKAKTAQDGVQLKALADQSKNQLVKERQTMDAQMDALKQQLAETEAMLDSGKDDAELQFKYWDSRLKYDTQMAQIAMQAKAAADNNDNKESKND